MTDEGDAGGKTNLNNMYEQRKYVVLLIAELHLQVILTL